MKKQLVAKQEKNTQSTSLSIDRIVEDSFKTFIIVNGSRDIHTGEKKEVVVLTKRLVVTSLVKKLKVKVLHANAKYIKQVFGSYSINKKPKDHELIYRGEEDAYICMECRCSCSLRVGKSCYDCIVMYSGVDRNIKKELSANKKPQTNYEEAVDITDSDLPF
ncbi:hypothetical protein O0Q50_20845 [Priestia aryabhattai]|uniref:Uncharacterized protein n=1 Tax=Priestia aryabhattai TaxID=412384 RepID=A0AAX6ND17_PRIAR|nr:hypothetical protein [Priestia aryabhattai]MDU9693626.1 hypothetical protein [Priestia aryabhattai]